MIACPVGKVGFFALSRPGFATETFRYFRLKRFVQHLCDDSPLGWRSIEPQINAKAFPLGLPGSLFDFVEQRVIGPKDSCSGHLIYGWHIQPVPRYPKEGKRGPASPLFVQQTNRKTKGRVRPPHSTSFRTQNRREHKGRVRHMPSCSGSAGASPSLPTN